MNFVNHILYNHLANFNQTWHHAFFGKNELKFVQNILFEGQVK